MSVSVGRDKPTFIINSFDRKNRPTTTSSDFFYKINISKQHDFDTVAISSIQIPKTFYTLQQGVVGGDAFYDNQFQLRESGGTVTITVPEGNYNIFNFPRVLKELLDANSPGGYEYIVTYPDRLTETDTGKFTFTVRNNAGDQPDFHMYDNRIREMMGLRCYDINGNPDWCAFTSDTLTSEFQVNMQWTNYITIKSNICHNAGNDNNDNAILAVIPVATVPDGSMINYTLVNLEEESKQLANAGSNEFSFSIYDDHNRLLDLRGSDWMIKLFLFKQNRYFDVAMKQMEIKQLELLAVEEKKGQVTQQQQDQFIRRLNKPKTETQILIEQEMGN